MSDRTVVYQGEPGSNSHLACRQAVPAAEPVGVPTFEEAFEAVQTGRVGLAMIPIENSLAGRVADIHHLLPDSGLQIIGEHFLPIHFHLMALPGATTDGLRTAESHLHALGQCRGVIKELGLRPVDVGDTAGAAHLVADSGDLTRGALAPLAAAEIYGLQVLRHNVEDAHHNATRFVVLCPQGRWQAQGVPVITTFVFRVRNIPAALYKALGGFATNGVNMTKLESYQLNGTFVSTQFYADVEGHPHDRLLGLALEELAFFTDDVRILGVYERHSFRDRVLTELAG